MLIYKKMSEIMKEIGAIGKEQKNTAQGFKFRGIDQFINALYPALVKNGVFLAPRCVKEEHDVKEVTRSNGKIGYDKHVTILVEYDFYADDGSKVTIGPVPGEGLDSGDKATNKALSAALKYMLIQTFSIPTEDMAEADLESPEISKTPAKSTPKVDEQKNIASGSLNEDGKASSNETPKPITNAKKGWGSNKPKVVTPKVEVKQETASEDMY